MKNINKFVCMVAAFISILVLSGCGKSVVLQDDMSGYVNGMKLVDLRDAGSYYANGEKMAALYSTANARNFRSWAAHSARNAVGNTATNISTSMQMNEVYNDKEMMKEQLEAVRKFCFDVFGYYVNQLKVLEDSPIEVIYSKDYEEAEENFKAAKNLETGSTENLALIKKVVETVPNRQDVYQYIISNYGDSDNAVCDFAKEIGINLENWKVAQAEERVKKDKVNDLSSEQKILAAIKVTKDDCKYWGVNYGMKSWMR